jgi:hypothetical protein
VPHPAELSAQKIRISGRLRSSDRYADMKLHPIIGNQRKVCASERCAQDPPLQNRTFVDPSDTRHRTTRIPVNYKQTNTLSGHNATFYSVKVDGMELG